MTSKDLDRLEKLADEVNILKDRLTALRNASAVSATNYSQTNGKCGVSDPVGNKVISEADLNERISEIQNEMTCIIDTVLTENNWMVRDVEHLHKLLLARYVDGQSYEKLCRNFYYSDSTGPHKYLSAFREKLHGISI